MRVTHFLGVAATAVGLVCSMGASTAMAITYAPVDAAGPPLTVPGAQLAASVRCTGDLAGSAREPVLLLPATGVNSEQNFAFNYEKAFRANGTAYCTSDQPGDRQSNLGDIQTRGEYVTYAIRTMHKLARRRIAVLGHSQGGMVMRWSLRFWPDTRAMVQDVIGMAGSNHGTLNSGAACAFGCAPAAFQQGADSNFIRALNSGQETFGGIDYTEAYSRLDEVVTPNLDSATGSSSVRGGPGRIANVALQDICPLDPSEHLLTGTTDAVAYALVDNALTHDGPADPARINRSVCLQPYQPGVDGSTVLRDSTASFSALGRAFATYPSVTTEPALRCYVTASCPDRTGRPQARCTSRRPFSVRLPSTRRLRAVRVTLNGRRLRIRRTAAGRRKVLVDLRTVKTPIARLRIVGRDPHGRVIVRTHRYRTCRRA